MLSPIELVKAAKKEISECDHQTLCKAIDNKAILIDVREPDEYNQGFIANAVNIPRGLIEFAIFDHPGVKPALNDDIGQSPIYLYCKSGGRSALAAQSLQNLGFKNIHSLAGGIQDWEAKGNLVNTERAYSY